MPDFAGVQSHAPTGVSRSAHAPRMHTPATNATALTPRPPPRVAPPPCRPTDRLILPLLPPATLWGLDLVRLELCSISVSVNLHDRIRLVWPRPLHNLMQVYAFLLVLAITRLAGLHADLDPDLPYAPLNR